MRAHSECMHVKLNMFRVCYQCVGNTNTNLLTTENPLNYKG